MLCPRFILGWLQILLACIDMLTYEHELQFRICSSLLSMTYCDNITKCTIGDRYLICCEAVVETDHIGSDETTSKSHVQTYVQTHNESYITRGTTRVVHEDSESKPY